MEASTAMHEEAPLGKVKDLPSSRPPSNNDNNTIAEYNDAPRIPTLASKFEELIAALPPLPMATPRPTPHQNRQGAKRRRGPQADSILSNKGNRDPFTTPKKQPAQRREDTAPSPDSLNSPAEYSNPPESNLIGHRLGVWRPAPAAASPSPNSYNATLSSHKNGSYHFGRVIAQEDIPPYRHIFKFDDENLADEYINLKNEVWVALCGDNADADSTTPITPSPAGKAGPTAAPDTSPAVVETPELLENKQKESTPEKIRKIGPHVHLFLKGPGQQLPVVVEHEIFSVYRTPCGPSGYEIYASFPELSLRDIKVECFARGKVQLKVKQPTPPEIDTRGDCDVEKKKEMKSQRYFEDFYIVELPSRIFPETARALFTSTGQLYIRVDRQEEKKIKIKNCGDLPPLTLKPPKGSE